MYDRGIAPVGRLPVPVISIGNITAGGTGKTPLTIHLARRLLALGLNPLVLTRGYRSTGSGTRIVSDGRRILLGPDVAGDEPLMIAASVPGLPVVVDPRRLRGGWAAIQRFRPDVVFLDDGFQHRRLARELDIVLLDAVDPFGRYALLPSGLLREPFSGLARAHIFIVTRAPSEEPLETLTAVLRRYNARAPILRASHVADSLVRVESLRHLVAPGTGPPGEDRQAAVGTTPESSPARGASPAPRVPSGEPGLSIGGEATHRIGANLDETAPTIEQLAGVPVFAFCGVGQPEGFRTTLQGTGARILGFEIFRDHHRYTAADIESLTAAARRAGAREIVTTEKDAVRIARMPGASRMLALRIRMEIIGEEVLLDAVRGAVGKAAVGRVTG